MLFSQELKINTETGKYEKIGVVSIDSTSKSVLFKKAIEWISTKYRSSNVIQFKDEESGKVIVKGNFAVSLFMKQGFIKHTLILEFKDNRFRYNYSDLSYYSNGSGEMNFEGSMGFKSKIISETEKNIDSSILDMTNFIKKDNKKSDNW